MPGSTRGYATRRSTTTTYRPSITNALRAFCQVDGLPCRQDLADAVRVFYDEHKHTLTLSQRRSLIDDIPRMLPRHERTRLAVCNSPLCPRGGDPSFTGGLLLCFQFPVTTPRLKRWYDKWAGDLPAVPEVVDAFNDYRQRHNTWLNQQRRVVRMEDEEVEEAGEGRAAEESVAEEEENRPLQADAEGDVLREASSREPLAGNEIAALSSEEDADLQMGTHSVGDSPSRAITIKDEAEEEQSRLDGSQQTSDDSSEARRSVTFLDDSAALHDHDYGSVDLSDISSLLVQISQPTALGHAYRELIRSTSTIQDEEVQRRHVELLAGFSRSMLERVERWERGE